MPTLIMTKGLPASGKTTWANEQVHKSSGRIKRINKDDLRAMIDAGEWSKQNERQIILVRDNLARHFLADDYDVIIDDTNLAPKHEEALLQLATEYGADFVIQDFTDVPLLECLKRNSERANSVPEETIRRMYDSFLRTKEDVAKYKKPVYNPDLPFCILVDIDGTLAHNVTDRSFYDWSRVGEDDPDEEIIGLVRKYASNNILEDMPENYIVIMSGRSAAGQKQTEEWLQRHNVPYTELHMRAEGDNRKDCEVKEELYNKFIKDRYNVRFVLDDRNQVVDKWRELGLKVLQVAPGDF